MPGNRLAWTELLDLPMMDQLVTWDVVLPLLLTGRSRTSYPDHGVFARHHGPTPLLPRKGSGSVRSFQRNVTARDFRPPPRSSRVHITEEHARRLSDREQTGPGTEIRREKASRHLRARGAGPLVPIFASGECGLAVFVVEIVLEKGDRAGGEFGGEGGALKEMGEGREHDLRAVYVPQDFPEVGGE